MICIIKCRPKSSDPGVVVLSQHHGFIEYRPSRFYPAIFPRKDSTCSESVLDRERIEETNDLSI